MRRFFRKPEEFKNGELEKIKVLYRASDREIIYETLHGIIKPRIRAEEIDYSPSAFLKDDSIYNDLTLDDDSIYNDLTLDDDSIYNDLTLDKVLLLLEKGKRDSLFRL